MPIEPDVDHAIGGKRRVRGGGLLESGDSALSRLASRQHGVVARRQLLDVGLGRRAIDHRLATGRLHVLHRGVYAVGHRRLSREGRWLAAVLAGGESAVLSHHAAGARWGLLAYSGVPEVTVRTGRRPVSGITWHSSLLPPDEVGRREGIPVTSVPRTLLDLATVLDRHRLAKAIDEAETQRLSDPLSLPALLERYPARRGVAKIRAILAAGRIGLDVPRNDFEIEFLIFIDRHHLPRPEVNAWLQVGDRWFEVDCLWRRERLMVELDSRTFHETSAAFERDRERDRALIAAGWRVIRITWRQLLREPQRLAIDIQAALSSRAQVDVPLSSP